VNGRESANGKRALVEPLVVALVVTAIVTGVSVWAPPSGIAVGVALVFLGATWFFVFRHSDDVVLRAGLGLGGLIASKSGGPASAEKMTRELAKALAIALCVAAITFVPFYLGFVGWWHPRHGFSLHVPLRELGSLVAGQLFVIALPEEAFYRGYVQSRLDEALPQRVRFLGANLGPSIIVTSAIFALGHIATVHHVSRLAVFFPSLLFGFLRARTGGVGVGVMYHAMCNVYSELLGRGFGVY
jgi:membrane protease YdiL (CAAX protease family)